MDSLRLLIRGSGLKVASRSQTEQHRQLGDGEDKIPDEKDGTSSRKRSRREFETDIGNRVPAETLSIDQIRQIQKSHKIRIANLSNLSKQCAVDSRKAQKEASRLFPQPLQQFSALRKAGANHALLSNLVEQGYREPTDVQLATIPMLMPSDGNVPNLLTVAPTGSGKTLAFLIPLIDCISKVHHEEDSETPQRHVSAIILAPTKELVTQIVNEGRKLAARTGVRITAFKKGMKLHDDAMVTGDQDSDNSQNEESSSATLVKADVVVSTPLSLLHAMTPSTSEEPLPLPGIQTLILDEADVLLDPLFRSQTISIWFSCTNPTLQTSLWSATIGSNIEELTMNTITTRQGSLDIKPKHAPPLLRCIIGLKDASLPNITHRLTYTSTEPGKLTGLRQLIRPAPSNIGQNKHDNTHKPTPILRPPFLIFTQTVSRAQALFEELQYDIPPPPSTSEVTSRIAVLHASLPDSQRARIMQNFRLAKIWVLITTDLLSRGIDFRGVNAVINYDIPTTSASYVHRAGRTGRAGRQGGVCVTFYTKDDVLYLRPIVNVIAKSQKQYGDESDERPEEMVPKWLLDSLPRLSKERKKEIRERGIDVRRAVKESDDRSERRRKGRNVIGTKSGYEKKLVNNRRGMVEGSRRRKAKEEEEGEQSEGEGGEDDFAGFG